MAAALEGAPSPARDPVVRVEREALGRVARDLMVMETMGMTAMITLAQMENLVRDLPARDPRVTESQARDHPMDTEALMVMAMDPMVLASQARGLMESQGRDLLMENQERDLLTDMETTLMIMAVPLATPARDQRATVVPESLARAHQVQAARAERALEEDTVMTHPKLTGLLLQLISEQSTLTC